ncbi:MAG: glycosyltransferase [Dactylosporangium sp.]|nr:glycosyltransferase [Dactylosporangium sp.]
MRLLNRTSIVAFLGFHALVGAGSFGCHLVASRALGGAARETLASLLVVVTILAMPATAVEAALAVRLGRPFARSAHRLLIAGGAACGVVVVRIGLVSLSAAGGSGTTETVAVSLCGESVCMMLIAGAVRRRSPGYSLAGRGGALGRSGSPEVVNPLASVQACPVDLTVVVPFYNPGGTLRANVLKLLAVLRDVDMTFEIIAVSDGCTDGSAATIEDLDPSTVRRFSLPSNAGKGAALRLGLREGRGRYLGFIDADGDLDPGLWVSFFALMRLYEPDGVIGAKFHPLSEVDHGVGGLRQLYSVGYRMLVRLLFPRLRIHETQVGIKVFRRELLADVLPRTIEHGFVFDLELLAIAHRLGYRRLLPAPVRLHRVGPSTVSAATVWRMLADTVAVAWRVRVFGTYDRWEI